MVFLSFVSLSNNKMKILSNDPRELSEEIIRLDAIFETAIDGIITIDKKGIIERANPAVKKLFGYELEELVGQNIKMLMPSPYHEEHDGYLENYHQSRKPKIIGIGREVSAKRKDGSIFPIRLAVSEMKLPKGIFYTGIIHDLSQQKEAESAIRNLNRKLETLVEKRTKELAKTVSQLLETNRELEYENREREKAEAALKKQEQGLKAALEKEKKLNELKSRFVSMASHEFRTPLSAVLAAAELIEVYERQDQQSKRVKNIGRIKKAVGTLIDILNDFLSLSKLEEGQLKHNPTSFIFNDFCEEVLDEMKGVLKMGQNIQHINLVANTTLFLDKNILKNILFNLISNASKYSEEWQNIHCLTKIERDKLSIQIRDEGMGIPKEDQQYLFSRFFRAHNVENIQGTGLGLNITKKYVKLLGGEISFESELGKGTTFFVAIPIKDKTNE